VPSAEGLTTTESEAIRADTWLIYEGDDDVAPDPDLDTPVVVEMIAARQTIRLSYDLKIEHYENEPVEVLVRTRRSGTPDVDSINTTGVSTTSEHFGPLNPPGFIHIGQNLTQSQGGGIDEIKTWIDEGNNIFWLQNNGSTQLWADTVLVWNLIYDANAGSLQKLCTPFSIDTIADVSGTGTPPIEVGTWTGIEKKLYINVNGQRVCVIDVLDESIQIEAIDVVQSLTGTISTDPIWEMWEQTALQVYDTFNERYVTAVMFNLDGVVSSLVGWSVEANQAACLP
jgi:hypothetical protein